MDLARLTEQVERKKVIVWDFDGTMVKLEIDWNLLKQELLQLAHPDQLKDTWLNALIYYLIGRGYKSEVFCLLKRHEQCAYRVNDLVIGFIKNCQKEKRHRTAILSDNLHETISRILTEIGIDKCFDVIIGKDDVTRYKPDPEGLHQVHHQLGSPNKKSYLLIGNSWKDREAALNFGIDFFIAGLND